MSEGVDSNERPGAIPHWVRPSCSVLVLVLIVLMFVPPLSTEAHRYEFVEAVQFSMFAMVIPALLTFSAPWGYLRLAGRDHQTLRPAARATGRPIDRLADGRRHHTGVGRAAAIVLPGLAVAIAWRTPAAVDLVETTPWVVVLEAASLLVVGVGLWLECISSPPLIPRSTRPMRIAICAVAMWTFWIMGYLIGFSRSPWYRAFDHTGGQTLSLAADQQFTTGVLCFFAACVFVPVMFWNLSAWLHSTDDPDTELHALLRSERRREVGSPSSAGIRRDRDHRTMDPTDESG